MEGSAAGATEVFVVQSMQSYRLEVDRRKGVDTASPEGDTAVTSPTALISPGV